MFAVRYLSLASLVTWLGITAIVLAGGATEVLIGELTAIGYTCGGTMLVCLVVLKLVGPPPSGFPLRAGLVSVMLLATAASSARRAPTPGAVANAAVGLVLLTWYARE